MGGDIQYEKHSRVHEISLWGDHDMACNKSVKTPFALATLIIIICTACQSSAVMLGMSTSKLTKSADLIITGNVISTKSDWTDDKKSIYTIASVLVDEVIKGKSFSKKIKVAYEGGEVDGIGLKVTDAVSLSEGERVLLFLSKKQNKTKEEAYKIFGNAQGKYTINNDNIAEKRGFSIASGEELIDNNLPVSDLIDKIKGITNE